MDYIGKGEVAMAMAILFIWHIPLQVNSMCFSSKVTFRVMCYTNMEFNTFVLKMCAPYRGVAVRIVLLGGINVIGCASATRGDQGFPTRILPCSYIWT